MILSELQINKKYIIVIKIISFLVKPLLNVVAWFLKLSRHNIYYLVSEPLRQEVQEVSKFIFAYQHIDNAIAIVKQHFKSEGNTILDVGGGTATTATLFGKAFPKHQIFVFEPIKNSFNQIENAPMRTNNWQLINKAVGSNPTTTQINIAKRITASSLLPFTHDEDIKGGYYDTVLQTERLETIEVTTLDHEIPKNAVIDVLKIDVQGFELEVLRGGIETLKRTRVIVLEVNNHTTFKGAPTYFELDEFFRKQGFILFDLLPSHHEQHKLLDWDAIYVNQLLKN